MSTLVLGGARSGKSRHALSLCREADEVHFLATARADDDEEMVRRIQRHRDERPSTWTTVEAPVELADAVRTAPASATVLVDCVTIWIANLAYELRALEAADREARIEAAVGALVEAVTARSAETILVSNEVGGGLVPETRVGREFRDLQGRANQRLAAACDAVVLVVAGISVAIK